MKRLIIALAITTAGHAAQYWSEESGRWEKKVEKN